MVPLSEQQHIVLPFKHHEHSLCTLFCFGDMFLVPDSRRRGPHDGHEHVGVLQLQKTRGPDCRCMQQPFVSSKTIHTMGTPVGMSLAARTKRRGRRRRSLARLLDYHKHPHNPNRLHILKSAFSAISWTQWQLKATLVMARC